MMTSHVSGYPANRGTFEAARSGSGNLDRGIGDGSALCGDDNAADERSREHETTPP